MSGLVSAISTGVTAFGATNIDDLVILTLFFSQINDTLRRWHIVIGQYLGFAALVIASLPGFFGGLILPRPWLGLLGLLPILIGIGCWFDSEKNEPDEVKVYTESSNRSILANFINLQIYSVAAVTFANGTDNISIYLPLFASSSLESLLVIVGVFFTLVGFLCFAAYKLTHQPDIAKLLTRYGHNLLPLVLIGLGVFLVVESNILNQLTLLAREFSLPWG